ncbi:unnamed protein product [Ixodes persulcatus]
MRPHMKVSYTYSTAMYSSAGRHSSQASAKVQWVGENGMFRTVPELSNVPTVAQLRTVCKTRARYKTNYIVTTIRGSCAALVGPTYIRLTSRLSCGRLFQFQVCRKVMATMWAMSR